MTLLARYPAVRTTNIDAWFQNLTERNPGTRPVAVRRATDTRCVVNALRLGSITIAAGRCAPYGLDVPADRRVRVHMPFAGVTIAQSQGRETQIPGNSPGVFLPRTDLRTLFPEGVTSMMLSVDKDALKPVLTELDSDTAVDALIDRAALKLDHPGMPSLRREVLRACQLHDEEPGSILDLERFRRGLEDAILLRVAHGLLSEPEAPVRSSGPQAAALRRCVDYLTQKAAGSVSMLAMARDAGTSLRQAQLLFRRELGTTPAAYLRTVRLGRARDMLQAPLAHSVTDVALACGFTHLGEFSGYYRNAFGETPSETLRRARRAL